MPLKIKHPVNEVAVLNRWADEVEKQIRATNVKVLHAQRQSVVAQTPSFDKIESGTNVGHSLTVGTGSHLIHAGTGEIDATEINGIPITGNADTEGKIPITQGDGTAVWGDPFVQGVQPEGTDLGTTEVRPVLIGGKDASGSLRDIAVGVDGGLKTAADVSTVLQEILDEIKLIRGLFTELFEEAGSKVSTR